MVGQNMTCRADDYAGAGKAHFLWILWCRTHTGDGSLCRAYRNFEPVRYFTRDRQAHLRLERADSGAGLWAEDAVRQTGTVAERGQTTLDLGDPLAGDAAADGAAVCRHADR